LLFIILAIITIYIKLGVDIEKNISYNRNMEDKEQKYNVKDLYIGEVVKVVRTKKKDENSTDVSCDFFKLAVMKKSEFGYIWLFTNMELMPLNIHAEPGQYVLNTKRIQPLSTVVNTHTHPTITDAEIMKIEERLSQYYTPSSENEDNIEEHLAC
jgi:hypothetical protein